MKPKVSVIVPVYNVESYLRDCLDSLVHQSLKSLEIIVVDDGSTDQSQTILKEYEETFPSLVNVYRKPNGGLSDARNFGLRYAKGEYIGFIDSDDYVEPTMFEQLLDEALRTKALVTVCDIDYVFDDKSPSLITKGLKEIDGVESTKAAFLSPLFAWNKLYHHSVFDEMNYRYPLGLWYEDIPVTVPLFSRLERIAYVPKALVHYRQRLTSIMGTRNSDKIGDIFTILDLVYDDFKQRSILDQYHDELEYLYIEHLLLYGAFRFYRSNRSKEWMLKAFKVMSQKFPQWKRNPYLKTLRKSYMIYLQYLNPFTWRVFQCLVLGRGR